MNTDRVIYITCYWNDLPKMKFDRSCVVWGKEKTHDDNDDESSSPILDDEEVFYYFQHDETILGNQGDFTVTEYEEEDGYIPS